MSSSAGATPTLIYLEVPGRGEISRLCFTLGSVEFVDKRIPIPEWPAYKPTTPFGQVPLLQIGDTIIAQSAAIDHYAAKLGGFIPEDPLQALLSDQAYFFLTQDIHTALISTTTKLKREDQEKARQEVAAGPLQEKFALLDKLVANRPGRFIAGDKLSLADFAIFNFLGMIKSGFWSGIPTDAFATFPALKAFRNEIASLPEVRAFYATATDDLRKKGYGPDDA